MNIERQTTQLIVCSRGSSLIRRINTERIALDPRVEACLHSESQESEENLLSFVSLPFTWTPTVPIPTIIPWAERLLQQVHASLSPLTINDVLIEISPRLLTLSPSSMSILMKKQSASSSSWHEEERLVQLLHASIEEKVSSIQNDHGGDICIFDAGIGDYFLKVFSKSLFNDGFGGGRMTALRYGKEEVPSIQDLFIACSTMSSWLALNEHNIIILFAPTHTRLNVFLAALRMYVSTEIDLLQVGRRMISWYTELVEQSTPLGVQIQKALRPMEKSNVTYSGGNVSQGTARLITDFAELVQRRDEALRSGVRYTKFRKK